MEGPRDQDCSLAAGQCGEDMEPDEQHLPNHVIMKCKMLLWVTGLYGRVRDRSLLMSYPGQPRFDKAIEPLRI